MHAPIKTSLINFDKENIIAAVERCSNNNHNRLTFGALATAMSFMNEKMLPLITLYSSEVEIIFS